MARKYNRDKLGRFAPKGGGSGRPSGRSLKPGEKTPEGMISIGNAQKGWKAYTPKEVKQLDPLNRRPKLGKEGRTGNYTKNQIDAARKRMDSIRREKSKILKARENMTQEQRKSTQGTKQLERLFRMGNAQERFTQTLNRAITGKRTRYENQQRRDLKVPRMNGRKFKAKN